MRQVGSRLAGAICGAAAGVVIASAWEASRVVRAAGGALSLQRVWAAELALLGPFALVVAVVVAAYVSAASLVWSGSSAQPFGLGPLDRVNKASLWVAGILVAPWVATALAYFVLAHLAVADLEPRDLAVRRSAEVGRRLAEVAVGTVAAGMLAWLAVAVSVRKGLLWVGARVDARAAAREGAARRSSSGRRTSVMAEMPWVLASIGVTAAFFLVARAVGDPSGRGPFPGIWGVLLRDELDLTPVAAVALAVIASGALASRAASQPFRKRMAVLALAWAVASCACAALGSSRFARWPEELAAVERFAPLGRRALSAMRSPFDRDGDGHAVAFGGIDCDDANPRVYPGALDVPGNGVDEDCDGRDEEPRPAPVPDGSGGASEASVIRAAPWRDALPKDISALLLTVDTLRADLGYAGYGHPISPEMDRLAARSVVFERAYAFASYTSKSLAPLLIGRFPSETARDGAHFTRFFPENVFLAERLKAAGFRTFGASSHFYLTPAFGLTQGFDVWDLSAKPPPGVDAEAVVTDDKVADVAIRLLGEVGNGTRFFGWFHFMDPHKQYVAHEGSPRFEEASRGAASARAAYDGEVWFTDRQLGRIFRALDELGLSHRTVVVVTADHGEAFGEHGMSFHGFELWEELVRVPLIVHVPGVAPRIVAGHHSHIDIVPTLLDVLGIPYEAGEVSGRSLSSTWSGLPESEPARDTCLDMPDGPYTRLRRGVVFGSGAGMKAVTTGVRTSVYDLERDPGERYDLAKDAEQLRSAMAALRRCRERMRIVEVPAVEPRL